MTYKELKELLRDKLNYGDKKGLTQVITDFVADASDENAAEYLASFIYEYFTTYKADAAAGIQQIVFRAKPSLGLVYFPDNTFLRSAILHGSMDLFDSYIEDFALPYLDKSPEVDKIDFYSDLMGVINFYTEEEDKKAEQIVKGMHFNGAINSEDDSNLMLINREDFEIMDSIVEKYNAVVGRKLIMKKIEDIFSEC